MDEVIENAQTYSWKRARHPRSRRCGALGARDCHSSNNVPKVGAVATAVPLWADILAAIHYTNRASCRNTGTSPRQQNHSPLSEQRNAARTRIICRSATGHSLQLFGISGPLHRDLGGGFRSPQIVRREFDGDCPEVLIQAMQLRGARGSERSTASGPAARRGRSGQVSRSSVVRCCRAESIRA